MCTARVGASCPWVLVWVCNNRSINHCVLVYICVKSGIVWNQVCAFVKMAQRRSNFAVKWLGSKDKEQIIGTSWLTLAVVQKEQKLLWSLVPIAIEWRSLAYCSGNPNEAQKDQGHPHGWGTSQSSGKKNEASKGSVRKTKASKSSTAKKKNSRASKRSMKAIKPLWLEPGSPAKSLTKAQKEEASSRDEARAVFTNISQHHNHPSLSPKVHNPTSTPLSDHNHSTTPPPLSLHTQTNQLLSHSHHTHLLRALT